MDAAHLLSRQRRPQSYRIPIQRIDGRCDRVRASTHRWLDEAPTSKGACLRLTFPTPVLHRFLPQRAGWPDWLILNSRRRRYRLCTLIRLAPAGTKDRILPPQVLKNHPVWGTANFEGERMTTYKRLDKTQAAVLMVDHQAGLMSLVRDIAPDQFKNNVLALADLAKYFALPTSSGYPWSSSHNMKNMDISK